MIKALEELDGIKKATASFPDKKAMVIYDPAVVTVEQMKKALLKVGCVAGPKENSEKNMAAPFNESLCKGDRQKDNLICYCFEYTKQDIEQDFIENGRSLIMEKIISEKRDGGCNCDTKNPKGR